MSAELTLPRPAGDPAPAHTPAARPTRLTLVLLGGVLLLAVLAVLSLFVGSGSISASTVVRALTGSGTSTDELLVRDFRVPRMWLALLVGMALGLSGLVMQALTRNPLADPGLLGVNAGAFFAIAMGTVFFGATATSGQLLWGVLGAAVAAAVVYVLGTTGFAAGSAGKLVLSGVGVGAVLSGVSRGLTLANPEAFDRLRFWSSGSLQGRTMDSVTAVWLPMVLAGVLVLALARPLNAMAMGEDIARSLGVHLGRVRLLGFLAVTVLCGAATSVAGPITFVGLIVPFVARFVVGADYRALIAVTVVAGPLLMLVADMLARVVVASELPVGVVVAFLGAPVLIALVRRTRMTGL